jgi:predicted porin
MSHTLKTGLLGALVALGLTIPALAADKAAVAIGNANAVSDLEERIAELEATTAKKGNRKVRVTISGQVNSAILAWDDGLTGKADARVVQNESYVTVSGAARFSKQLEAGFVIELGLAPYNVLADQLSVNQSNEVYTRRAATWLRMPLGKITVGKDSDAADGIVDSTSVVNTRPAVKMLSFAPLLGGDGMTENLDLFDGQKLDVLRYDSPAVAGFTVSASWSRSGVANGDPDVEDVFAVAVRYFEEVGQFKVAGGAAYRQGAVFPGLDPILNIGQVAFDQETISGSVSVLHMPTGVFVNAAAGQATFGGNDKITAWTVMPGVEERWISAGKTTLFGEYATFKMDDASDDLTYIGLGAVQAVDAAALSLYITARRVEVGDEEFIYGLGGVAIGF